MEQALACDVSGYGIKCHWQGKRYEESVLGTVIQ